MGLGMVRDVVTAAWKANGGVEVKMIGFNMSRFSLKDEGEARKILNENPWVVRNNMLSLQKRRPFLSDNEIQINTCEFWVQFHNLPWEGRIESNIRLMANVVGRVIAVENPEDKRYKNRSFGRARVEVDNERSLVPGFLASRPNDQLDKVWIQVTYEKLVRFCFNCGKLGHESKSCEEEVVEFTVNGVTRGYDASLCAHAVWNLPGNESDRNSRGSPERNGASGSSKMEIGGSGNKGMMWVLGDRDVGICALSVREGGVLRRRVY